MTELYDQRVAAHYQAYRPPLHELILQRLLDDSEGFDFGLDVGCGTGRSTIALKAYCSEVMGLDPGQDMLDRCEATTGISYVRGQAASTGLPNNSVDLVSFAGSLFYCKSQALIVELQRICRPGASILVYDFEVQLESVLSQLGLEATKSSYEHETNFSDAAGLEQRTVEIEGINLETSSAELNHIILSDSHRYMALESQPGGAEGVLARLDALADADGRHRLEVTLYYARYLI